MNIRLTPASALLLLTMLSSYPRTAPARTAAGPRPSSLVPGGTHAGAPHAVAPARSWRQRAR